MDLNSKHSNSIRRYLLGELPEQEREKIEDLLMSDNDAYQELLFAEDDLIDDYVFNVLPEADRKKFTQRFLTIPELRQNVSLTTALRKHALATKPQTVADTTVKPSLLDRLRSLFMQPVFAVSFAGLLIAALTLDAWLLRQNSQLKGRVEQLEARQRYPLGAGLEQLAAAEQRNQQLSDELREKDKLLAEKTRELQIAQSNQSKPGPNPATVFAIALTAGVMRDSGEWKKLPLDPAIRRVSFDLDVAAGEYARYQAVLQTVEGQHKFSRKNLTLTRGNVVSFNVPATVLSRGDYHIELKGVKPTGELADVANYYFRVLN